jgi:hypothetical protein
MESGYLAIRNDHLAGCIPANDHSTVKHPALAVQDASLGNQNRKIIFIPGHPSPPLQSIKDII